jgi:hypothetical protein
VPDGFLSNNKTEYEFNIGSGLFRTIPQYIKEFSKNNNDELTPLELHTLDTWFALHPEKVCGVQKGGSGFSFPVKTIGTKQDIINAIDATLGSGNKLTYGTKSNKVSMADDDIDLKEELAITENIKKTIASYEEYFRTTTDSILSREYKEAKKMLASSKKQLDIQNKIILPYAEKLDKKTKQPDWLFIAEFPTGMQYTDTDVDRKYYIGFEKIAFVYNEPQYNWDKNDVSKTVGSPYRVQVESTNKKYAELIAELQNKFDLPLQSNTKPNELNLNNKPIKPKTNLNTQYFCCERFSDGAKKVLQPQGIKVILPQFENINFFAHKGIYVSDGIIKDEKYWSITEVKTGVSVVTGKYKITTKQAAIEKTIEIINYNGGEQGLIAAIEKPINNLCADNVVTPATKTNLSLYKYKAKALSIKLQLLQA